MNPAQGMIKDKGKMAIARTLAMIFLPGLAVQKVKAELTF
jgi:hypothetical protein